MNNKKIKCPDCGVEVTNNNIKKHIGSKACLRNQQNKKPIKIQEEWKQLNGKYKCPYCGKEYSRNGISTHIWRNHKEGISHSPNKGKETWNKGLTKESNNSIKKGAETFKRNFKNGKFNIHNKGKKLSKEHRKAVSEGMKKAHKEGRAHNIGTCRWNNKMSYPEEFFTKVIENEFIDKNYTNEYPVGIYSIDFAWVDKKLAIEIDGEQHERPEYKARDKRKDEKLYSEGWDVLRIKWKDMFHETKKWIQIAKDFIE